MFFEALPSQEIIDVSKRWQAKVSSAAYFSPRELYDLSSDVMKIRATVGLTSGRGNVLVADLSHNMVNIRLVFASGNLNDQYIDIVVKQAENTQDLSEAYHLEKKPDHFGIFAGTASLKKDLVSIRHSASFKSPLGEGVEVLVKGESKYENDRFSFWDIYSRSVVAKAIWNSHLENDAPLKNEYLTLSTVPPIA